jgi:hypothetical protein
VATVYVVVSTFHGISGRVQELIDVLHQLIAINKKVNDIEATVLTPVAGKLSEVKLRWQVSDLSQYEKNIERLESNPEWVDLFKKAGALVVPNTSHTDIYRERYRKT